MTENSPSGTSETFSEVPNLSLDELLQLLEIYKDSAQSHLRLSEDDEAASYLLRAMSNAIFYLSLFRESIPVMEKLTQNINFLKLKHMRPPSSLQ